MRSIPDRKLWLGNAGDLREQKSVMALGVEAVVELAAGEPMATLPRDLIRLRIPISDGAENPAWLLKLATDGLASLIRAGVPTLACCSAGMSRSICVAAAALSVVDCRPFDEMLADITKSGPCDVSPALYSQFKQFMG